AKPRAVMWGSLELVRRGLTAAARLAQLGVAHVVVDAGVAVPDPPGRASLDAILGERGVGQLAADSVWSSRFRVAYRVADRFRPAGVFVCVDAAHVRSPAAGHRAELDGRLGRGRAEPRVPDKEASAAGPETALSYGNDSRMSSCGHWLLRTWTSWASELPTQYGVCWGSRTARLTGATSSPQGWIELAKKPSRRKSLYSGSHQMANARCSSRGSMATHTPEVTVYPPVNLTGSSARTNAPTEGICIITGSSALLWLSHEPGAFSWAGLVRTGSGSRKRTCRS